MIFLYCIGFFALYILCGNLTIAFATMVANYDPCNPMEMHPNVVRALWPLFLLPLIIFFFLLSLYKICKR